MIDYKWLILILFIILIVIRNRIRGYSWKARDGSKLTLKQFFKRWGQGIEGITPIQQTRTQMLGAWIITTGLISGLIINLLVRIQYQWYWISIVLVGSLFINLIGMVGTYQKYRILKKVEETIRSLNKNVQKKR